MKHLHIFSIISFITLFSCTPVSEIDNSPAIITGRIINQQVYTNVKEITLTVTDFNGNGQKIVSPIEANGVFKFEFIPKTTREISLSNIEDIVVVSPGCKMHIEKDFKKLLKTTFSGHHAPLNNHISSFRGYYLGRYPYNSFTNNTAFKHQCDSMLQVNHELLNSFAKRRQSPPEFVNWAKQQIELDYQMALIMDKHLNELPKYNDLVSILQNTVTSDLVKTQYFSLSQKLLTIWIDDFYANKGLKFNSQQKMMNYLIKTMLNNGTYSFVQQLTARELFNIPLALHDTKILEPHIEEIKSLIHNPFLASNFEEHYQKVTSQASSQNKSTTE